jgi:hypothetical protein
MLENTEGAIKMENPEKLVAGHSQSRAKMTVLKGGGVDGFSYFTLISVILFCNHDYPRYRIPVYSWFGLTMIHCIYTVFDIKLSSEFLQGSIIYKL